MPARHARAPARPAGHLQAHAARQAGHDVQRHALPGHPPRLQEVHARRACWAPTGLLPACCASSTHMLHGLLPLPYTPSAASRATRRAAQRTAGSRPANWPGPAMRGVRRGAAAAAGSAPQHSVLAAWRQGQGRGLRRAACCVAPVGDLKYFIPVPFVVRWKVSARSLGGVLGSNCGSRRWRGASSQPLKK